MACPVCLETFSKGNLRRFKCGHFTCKECHLKMEKYCARHSQDVMCPLCRNLEKEHLEQQEVSTEFSGDVVIYIRNDHRFHNESDHEQIEREHVYLDDTDASRLFFVILGLIVCSMFMGVMMVIRGRDF
jgi:Ring finger domain